MFINRTFTKTTTHHKSIKINEIKSTQASFPIWMINAHTHTHTQTHTHTHTHTYLHTHVHTHTFI